MATTVGTCSRCHAVGVSLRPLIVESGDRTMMVRWCEACRMDNIRANAERGRIKRGEAVAMSDLPTEVRK